MLLLTTSYQAYSTSPSPFALQCNKNRTFFKKTCFIRLADDGSIDAHYLLSLRDSSRFFIHFEIKFTNQPIVIAIWRTALHACSFKIKNFCISNLQCVYHNTPELVVGKFSCKTYDDEFLMNEKMDQLRKQV